MAASSTGMSSPLPQLHLRASTVDGCTTVTCSGRLVFWTGALFKDEATRLFARSKRLVLDLADLTFMDSSGIGLLVALHNDARADGCDLRLVNASRQVRNLLRVTNLTAVLMGDQPENTRQPRGTAD